MKYRLKDKVRTLANNSIVIGYLYQKASELKTIRNKKLDDVTFFKRRYKEYTGKELNLDNPMTFNEKLIWLQLYDHDPVYTLLSDKYKVKDFVTKTIGPRYVVPVIGVWDSVEKIPFSDLPEEYVLKCNHDCGSIFIKRKGERVDTRKVKRRFKKALSRNYYDVGRVWGYKNIEPLIFCEELIQTVDGKPPKDYKVFCFDGEPKFALVVSDRDDKPKFDFFDLEWNRIPVRQHYPNSHYDIPKPEQWEEMLACARKLSKGIPHVRVDFYIDAVGQVFFGEMTFCHFSGKEPFEPDHYDALFGSYLRLPPKKQEDGVPC